jgi:hypothetical protein
MTRRERRRSQQDLRAMGARPGRLATRYTPDGERAQFDRIAEVIPLSHRHASYILRKLRRKAA